MTDLACAIDVRRHTDLGTSFIQVSLIDADCIVPREEPPGRPDGGSPGPPDPTLVSPSGRLPKVTRPAVTAEKTRGKTCKLTCGMRWYVMHFWCQSISGISFF